MMKVITESPHKDACVSLWSMLAWWLSVY